MSAGRALLLILLGVSLFGADAQRRARHRRAVYDYPWRGTRCTMRCNCNGRCRESGRKNCEPCEPGMAHYCVGCSENGFCTGQVRCFRSCRRIRRRRRWRGRKIYTLCKCRCYRPDDEMVDTVCAVRSWLRGSTPPPSAPRMKLVADP